MVPFIAKVPFVVSQPTSRYSDWITVTVAGAPRRASAVGRLGAAMSMTHEMLDGTSGAIGRRRTYSCNTPRP